ncbi:xenotropic and polytropic retrovirus receptor 1 [Nematocida major]|uniref:xenotropic and polytropic retrovirus receptor 1 n=1 Tax=Nematocida major TaxID=1912982 RepID=UPI002008D34E|nr:xenotropic and polytropic retrovirus receptor 1 [Nematocida major]KAH9385737.1 xenotropic and polytropic retrovirus receptor 1 [Nematocida major]
MKFSKTLKEKQVQEWRAKYLNYEALKGSITQPEQVFMHQLGKEIEKVEVFYKVLERGVLRGLADLLEFFPEEEFPHAYELVYANWKLAMAKSAGVRQKKIRHERHAKKITKKAQENKILEYYVALNKVLQYKRMNMTGFRKILKKYDKLNGTFTQDKKMEEIRTRTVFMQQTIEEIMEFTRYIHKEITPDKKRDRAKRMVVDLTQEDAEGDGKSFSAGMMCAAGMSLVFMSINSGQFAYYGMLYAFDALFITFGILFYICRKNLVNYTLILELNLKPKFKISRYFLMCTGMFFAHAAAGYAELLWPITYGATFLLCISPVYFFREIRIYFIRSISEILGCMFFGRVHFKHFFIADHLLSVRPVIITALTVGLKEPPGHILAGAINQVPVAVRILQCLRRYFDRKNRMMFPHLYNTLKYMISFLSDTLLLLSDLVNPWVCGSVLAASQVCGFYWDVCVDWMLWRRPKVYSTKLYWMACIFNAAVRSTSLAYFVASTAAHRFSFKQKVAARFAMSCMEMARRIIWAVIRIEVEHLNNCNQLKAISGPLSELFYLEDDGQME